MDPKHRHCWHPMAPGEPWPERHEAPPRLYACCHGECYDVLAPPTGVEVEEKTHGILTPGFPGRVHQRTPRPVDLKVPG